MVQQIIVKDEKDEKIGIMFPKRAKQLVNKQKAIWLNEEHTEVQLFPEKEEISLNPDLKRFVNELFTDITDVEPSGKIINIKKKFMENLNEKYEVLIDGGMDKNEAVEKLIKDAGSADEIVKKFSKEKSIIKDAYRDSVSVVLKSSPIEIIKKSKKRTRELHAAFSAVLWAGAAMIYFGLSFLLGYRNFSLNVTEWSWTWLVFALAALIECGAEIYFCKKELDVLNENIDLRQINPAKGGDFDLWNYQKRLTKKIKFMSYAVIWIPLIIVYFSLGYIFRLWSVAWIVFVFGAFFELLRNFIKILKNKE